ncbi:MAG: nucleotide exchange factor GrpE [Candidatus Ozemobacteraceae bacterium]
MTLDSERRTRILATLTTWIDEGLADESLPDGFPEHELADADQPDWLTVITALTTLSEDMRLQGKHFRKLQESLASLSAPTPSKAPAAQESMAQPVLPVSELLEAGREEGRTELLNVLLDVHDRLQRTLEEAEKQLATAGWWRNAFGAVPVEKAMTDGLRLTVKRFDELLAGQGASRFGTVGEAFDPMTMKAVDAIESSKSTVPAGHVSGIIASGYRRSGRLLRSATVQVAR